ncbi:hypothetical protein PLEOSDRAFT_1071453, partial [Pleurotus ostreatus PC15]
GLAEGGVGDGVCSKRMIWSRSSEGRRRSGGTTESVWQSVPYLLKPSSSWVGRVSGGRDAKSGRVGERGRGTDDAISPIDKARGRLATVVVGVMTTVVEEVEVPRALTLTVDMGGVSESI